MGVARRKRRHAAARRIAAALPRFAFKAPAVQRAVRDYVPAGVQRNAWLRETFARFLVVAAKEAATPQPRIRLGRHWVKDRQGRVLEQVAPLELAFSDTCRWLLQRAWRLMELDMLGEGDGPARRDRRRLARRDREALGEDPDGLFAAGRRKRHIAA
jgi:hypothetical protein